MSSGIYIFDAPNVPEANVPRVLKSNLSPLPLPLRQDMGNNKILGYHLGTRNATNPLPPNIPKGDVESIIESLTPRYTLLISREELEQLSDAIGVYVLGSPPYFENIGELKAAINQATENGYRIMYEREAVRNRS